MPVDTSIYRQQQQPDLMQSVGQMLSMRAMIQNQEAQQVQLQQQRRAIADDDASRKLFATTPDATDDQVLATLGPLHGGAVLRVRREQQKSELDRALSELTLRSTRAKLGGQVLAGVKDQASYQAALPVLAQILGPEAAQHFGPEFDPQRVQQFVQSGLTTEAQLEEARRVAEEKRKELEFGWKKAAQPFQQKETEAKATTAQQVATGTQPLTPYQQEQLKAQAGNVTESELALRAAKGDPVAQKALKAIESHKLASRPVVNVNGGGAADAPKQIADAIVRGEQPPDVKGLYRMAGPVRVELARQGYDMMTAQADWQATQKHIATLNGPQQERLKQAITFTYDSLDNIEGLYGEWKKVAGNSGFKVLNRANLAAMKQLPGKAGEIATSLEAQINDLTSELGTVYKGGNGSTDESLKLASANLKAEWNDQTFSRALTQIRKNLTIRRNSMLNSKPSGLSTGSADTPPPTETKVEKWGVDASGKLVKQ